MTDVVALAAREAAEGATPVQTVTLLEGTELLGVNDLVQLEQATRAVYRSTARRLMQAGVRIIDSANVYIGDDVEIGADTVVHPFSTISGPFRVAMRPLMQFTVKLSAACASSSIDWSRL